MKRLNLILVCIAIVALGSTATTGTFDPSQSDTFPGAGPDEFNSTATLSVQIMGYTMENVQFSGPTRIERSDPTDHDSAPDTVEAVMVELELDAEATVLGDISVTLSPYSESVGMIIANQDEPDFPADSYFDIWSKVVTTNGPVNGTYYTDGYIRMEGRELMGFPPYGVIYGPYKPADYIPLRDLPPPYGDIVGYLFHVTHEVAITLNHFTVYSVDDAVMIEWTTGTEMDNAGFNLYRSEQEDEGYVSINEELIPPEGDATTGAVYSFSDPNVHPGATYYYTLESITRDEEATLYGPVIVKIPMEASIPTNYLLSQNYPNPFNPRTTIEFELPEKSHVSITIYNSLGQWVKGLVNKEWPAGRYQTFWDGKGQYGETVPSGVYFCKITAGHWTDTKKMMLMK